MYRVLTKNELWEMLWDDLLFEFKVACIKKNIENQKAIKKEINRRLKVFATLYTPISE